MTDAMNVLHRSVRLHNSELDVAFYFGAKRRVARKRYLLAVFWVYLLQELLPLGWALLRIEAEKSEHFVRPVDCLSAGAINGATSRVGLPLRFGQISLATPQSFLGTLLFTQIENVGDPLVRLAFEASCPDQDRHTAAVLPEILFLTGLHHAGRLELFSLVASVRLLPFRRRHVEPSKPCLQILALVPDHMEKRIIGIDKSSVQIPDDDPDDVRIDQAPDPPVTFFKIPIKPRILKRYRCPRRKRFCRAIAFEVTLLDAVDAHSVEHPDQYQKNGQACRAEPAGLIVGRGDREIHSCASVVPDSIVVTRDHTEPIRSRI